MVNKSIRFYALPSLRRTPACSQLTGPTGDPLHFSRRHVMGAWIPMTFAISSLDSLESGIPNVRWDTHILFFSPGFVLWFSVCFGNHRLQGQSCMVEIQAGFGKKHGFVDSSNDVGTLQQKCKMLSNYVTEEWCCCLCANMQCMMLLPCNLLNMVKW